MRSDKPPPTLQLPAAPLLTFFSRLLQCLQIWLLQQCAVPPLWCFLAVSWLLYKKLARESFLVLWQSPQHQTAKWRYLIPTFPFLFRSKCAFAAFVLGWSGHWSIYQRDFPGVIAYVRAHAQSVSSPDCVQRVRVRMCLCKCVHRRWSSHTEIIYQTLLSRIKVT